MGLQIDQGLLDADMTQVGTQGTEPGVHVAPGSVPGNYAVNSKAVTKVVKPWRLPRRCPNSCALADLVKGLPDTFVDQGVATPVGKERCFGTAGHTDLLPSHEVGRQGGDSGFMEWEEAGFAELPLPYQEFALSWVEIAEL